MKYLFYYYLKIIRTLLNKDYYFSKFKSQSGNNEKTFITKLYSKFENKVFLEIGFHWFQFNCIGLVEKNFKGFLIDGGKKKNIIIMKLLCYFHNFKIKVLNLFVDTENILKILPKNLGILSIDIDGNDYWILKKILENKQDIELIVVEYNSSLLDKSISVPYDKNFERHKKHKSGLYHGASLKAFIKLLNKYEYCLVKTFGGVNAFFVKRKDLLKFSLIEINFEKGYEENTLRNKWWSSTAKDQFKIISDLEYVEV